MAKKSMKNWFGLGKKATSNTDEDKVNPALLVSSDDETAEEKAIRRAADLQLIADFENNSAASETNIIAPEPVVIVPEVVVTEPEIVAATPAADAVSTNANAEIKTDTTADVVIADAAIESVNEDDKSLVAETESVSDESADEPADKEKFFTRLKRGLSRTKGNIGSGFKTLFRGKHIDDELFEELEEQLLIADLGVATTTRIIDNLTQQASRKELKDAEALYDILKKDMAELLHKVDEPLVIDSNNKPHVILMVGVNGVGKTTTIGKMAKKFQAEGQSVMLAAGDTFRAAAVEQLQVWGERNDIPVVAQHTGADSASVLFDAMQSATAKDVDVLIADTAGRLQNKAHLMEELKKVVRVMRKHDATAPHEIMLTIDAGTGQNALSQAELFKDAVGLTGIALTKLDGTAKGGVIFAVADKFEIPIRFIGIGEGIDDLRTFNSEEFIEALFSNEEFK
ncbi:MAG: signal recognition particle-docking protein FtsY [Moritella sp.]|uniref:signal recognition particle-docking protein FtsY n=1 Tax=Moritella sp. TaxID=78556 RepID=UPI0029B63BB0|nr:signal recognition particle-docking protein FtsY [Moritella sp.]MDX2321819.1 signal recognition particle-docking protein FtsY [Moritella sp.]